MKSRPHQLSSPACDQNINGVNTGERFESRGEIYRVADHGRIEPFVRLVRSNVADNGLAMIDANAECERLYSLSNPGRI